MILRPSAAFLSACAWLASPAYAAEADGWFGDHMVVQRDRPLAVWGRGEPGERVAVSFHGQRAEAVTGADGAWAATLPAFKMDAVGAGLEVRGERGGATFRDVRVGDVWVCAGQSNMEFPLSREAHAKEALREAGASKVSLRRSDCVGRFVYGKPWGAVEAARLSPERLYRGAWETASPASAAGMSAVGWYFAQEIATQEGVPVGLVDFSVGGSPIEAWIPEAELARAFPAKVRGNWLDNAALPAWVRARGRENLAKVAQPPGDDRGPLHPYKPGALWAGGPGRMVRAQVAGVLWYQGESNAGEPERVKEYADLFASLVGAWRRAAGRPDLPFLTVQLPGIGADEGKEGRRLWPEFREAQRRTAAADPRVAMAVTLDLGAKADVHPREKREVGRRLARLARVLCYGHGGWPTGPQPVSAAVRAGRVEIVFRGAGAGLATRDGKPPGAFELAGNDGRFLPASAVLDHGVVVLDCPAAPEPAQVRHAWAPWPANANLVGEDNLPAPSFLLPVGRERP